MLKYGSFVAHIKNFLVESKVRQGLPHITTMSHEQLTNLTKTGKVHLDTKTEKTDGSVHQMGYDEHGFYTQYSGSGAEKMRSKQDYIDRAKRRSEETGKPLDLSAAHTFGHIHEVLSRNGALQQHLESEHKKSGGDIKVKGEVFYRPNAKEGDHPGEVKFVGTSYKTDHMGSVGKYVIHSKLPENQHHDTEHFKKSLSNSEMNFDDDKIEHHEGDSVDVKKEHEELKGINHELLKQRTSKSNKEAKEAEQAKLEGVAKRISDKVDAHIKKKNLSPKWGSGSEGIVVHPSASNPEAPRFKVTSDAFRKYRESDEAKNFKNRLKSASKVNESSEEVHHASVIPLTGFSPISHMGHAHDLGHALSKLPGQHHIGISDKAETFTGKERADILHRQWKDKSKNLNVHVTSSGGEVVANAFRALPKTGRRVLHILVGHDRKSFAEGLKKSLEAGKIKEMNGEHWDEIHIHHPEGEDRSHGMSGTKMRTAVANGDMATFRKHLGPNFSEEETKKIHDKIKSAIDSGELAVDRTKAKPKKKSLKEFFFSLLEGGNVKIGEHSASEIKVTPESRESLKSDVHGMLSDLHDSFHKEHGEHLFGKGKKALNSGSAFSGSTHHLMDSSISNEEFAKHKSKVGDLDVKIPKEHGDKLHAHLQPGKKFGKYTVIGTKKAGNDIHALVKHENGQIHQIDFEKTNYEHGEPSKFDQFGRSSNWEDVKGGVKGAHHKILLNAAGTDKHKFSIMLGAKSRTDESEPWETDTKKITHKLFGKDANEKDLHSFHGLTRLIKKHIPKEKHQEIFDKFKDSVSKMKGIDSKKALDHLKANLHVQQNESSRFNDFNFLDLLESEKNEREEDGNYFDEENDDECCDLSDDQLDDIADNFDEEDAVELYHPDEFAIVDKETGEPVNYSEEDEEEKLKESVDLLTEALSREGRIKRRMLFARTKSKRERALALALHKTSSSRVISKRSRVAAVSALKKKMLRGRDYSTLSEQEKQALERRIDRMSKSGVVARLAMKLAPKIRKIEKERLAHSKYTDK